MRKSLLKNKGAWIVLLYDLGIAFLSWVTVHALISGKFFSYSQFFFVFVAFAFSLKFFRTYAALWKTISADDLKRNIFAVATGSLLFFMFEFLTNRLVNIARAEVVFYPTLTLVLMLAGRFIYRQFIAGFKKNKGKDLIVIGAGDGANLFLKENSLLTKPYNIVALLDDNKNMQGKSLRNVEIAGSIDLLFQKPFLNSYLDSEILIAIPSLGQQELQKLLLKCSKTNLPVKILPPILELMEGSKSTEIREIELEDLLGRDSVSLDWQKISSGINHKKIIITGGGGSIGSELCRQIAKLNPSELLIIDNSEFNLYQIELELNNTFKELNLTISLTSVVDKDAIDILFNNFKPDVVFHAAAYKHVPMLEQQIRIAVRNNILGTQIISDASSAYNVEKFVLISTDKAVNPTNIMGTTKRAAEIYVQNLNLKCKTNFITVRFGNVLGSAGSVVPLFKKQLKQGGPLTVTHPEICRYFMTIPEASQLIMQAMVNGVGGEIFVLDMGEPIKISFLAEQIIRLSGKVPYQDIDIKYTGLRLGEKLYEELFHESEKLKTTEHPKILKAKVRQISWSLLLKVFKQFDKQCLLMNEAALLDLLLELVPEYVKTSSKC